MLSSQQDPAPDTDDVFVRMAPVRRAEGVRVVRVFVSSTFRDMHAERDVLGRFVFPALQKRCAERDIEFSFVDLRWGITDEQVAGGRVLPICLGEIERCRPYFIGLLAQQYGSVATDLPPEVAGRYPWLAGAAGRGVTEIEMLMVLDDPTWASQTFFYLRSPDYLAQHDADTRRAWTSTGEAADRLAELRTRILASGLPVAEYPSPEALGALVQEQLWAAIDAEFPPLTPEDALEQESHQHRAAAQGYTRVYVGRRSELARLTAHVHGDSVPLVIAGAAGVGKSALIANWLHDRPADDLPTIFHMVGATPESDQWEAMLARLMALLSQHAGVPGDTPDDPEERLLAFQNLLVEVGRTSRVLLVVDGVDRLNGPPNLPPWCWLPLDPSSNMRMVITVRPGPVLTELERRGWPIVTVEPLAPPLRRALAEAYLGRQGRALSEPDLARLADAPSTQMPLFLRLVLQELGAAGAYERLSDQIAEYVHTPSLDALYAKVFRRWEDQYGREMVARSLSLIGASRYGLPESDLREMLNAEGQRVESSAWSPFFLHAELEISPRPGLLALRDAHLRAAVTALFGDAEEPRAASATITEFYRRVASIDLQIVVLEGVESRHPEIGPAVREARQTHTDRRRRAFLEVPYQLRESGQWAALYAQLQDAAYVRWALVHARTDLFGFWRLLCERGYRVADAYRAQLDGAVADDLLSVEGIADLLHHVGEHAATVAVRGRLDAFYQEDGDRLLLGISTHKHAAALQRAATHKHAAALQRAGDEQGALAALRAAQAIYGDLGDSTRAATALADQAFILMNHGEPRQAFAAFDEAMRVFQEQGDARRLAIVYNGLGALLVSEGQWPRGLEYLRRAEDVFRQTGNREQLGKALTNKALGYARTGQHDRARQSHQEALALVQELGDVRLIARVEQLAPMLEEARCQQDAQLVAARPWYRRLLDKVSRSR